MCDSHGPSGWPDEDSYQAHEQALRAGRETHAVAMKVTCPSCGAVPGRRCRSASGNATDDHAARVRTGAAHSPVTDDFAKWEKELAASKRTFRYRAMQVDEMEREALVRAAIEQEAR